MSHHNHRRQIALILTFTVLILVGLGVSAHAGVKVHLGDNREAFIDFLSKEDNLSREGAAKLAAYCERTSDSRIINEWELPQGTVLDYYHLGQQTPGGPEASYNGSAVLVHRESRLGQAYLRKAYAELTVIERVNKWFGDVLAPNNHMVLVPVGMLSPGQGADLVAALAGATETRRVAIIATEFPPWEDRSPAYKGAPGDNQNEYAYYYAWDAATREFPMYMNLDYDFNGTVDAGEESFKSEWVPSCYADSPGGPFINQSGHQRPSGLHNVSWEHNASDTMPAIPTPYSIELSRKTWTEFQLQTQWWNLLFNRSNRKSLTNYYYENSHGHVTIEGDRSDIFGWMRSHHVLDRNPFGSSYDYIRQPGTPIIRPFLVDATHPQRIIRASITQNEITVLFAEDVYGASISELRVYQEDGHKYDPNKGKPDWVTLLSKAGWDHHRDPFDYRRHQWVNTGGSDWYWHEQDPADATKFTDTDYEVYDNKDWKVTVSADGTSLTWDSSSSGFRNQDRGCAGLGNTTFTTSDVYAQGPDDTKAWIAYEAGAGPYPTQKLFGSCYDEADGVNYGLGNRLKTFAYYHHGHYFYHYHTNEPYQLRGLENESGYRDDIGGTVDHTDYHVDRPYPFDFDEEDMNHPNRGFWLRPQDTNHTTDDMVNDINKLMVDMGMNPSGYDSIAYLFPYGDDGGAHENSAGYPMTPRFSPGMGYVLLPEDSELTLAAHEFGDCLFDFVDLYDQDYYNNSRTATPPQPPHKECWAMGSYSVMAYGVRVDAWHKITTWIDPTNPALGTWVTPIDVIEDRLNVEIPQIEGTLREPVILKLPANPYDIVDGTLPANWDEYYLVENRWQTGADYYGDPSPQGLYIYHVDNRQIRYAPRYIKTFQVEERALSVAMEQADGKNELEGLTNAGPAGAYNADPFPGADNVRSFSQLPTLLDDSDPDLGQRWSPTSWSHGDIIDSGPLGTVVIKSGTPTDSFSRVVNISDPGVNMSADVFVEPREIVVTDESVQAAADSGAIVWPDGADISQSDRLKGVLAMKLDNPQHVPGSGDYSKMSTGEVIVSRIKILESGTAAQVQGQPHPAVEQAYLYAETNGIAGLQVEGATTDSRIGSATFGNYDPDLGAEVPDYAVFTSLGYRIPAGESRTIYVVYDILENAQINPQISIGAELTDYTFIRPDAPGAVCERTRGAAKWEFGAYYFPLVSQTSLVIEQPDWLIVTPNPVPDADHPLGAGIVAPDSVSQGQLDVPLLQMRMEVTRDEVILRQMKVNATIGAGWVDAQEDLTVLRLYVDVNANGLVDPGSDYLLAEANFAIVGGVPQAVLQLDDVSEIDRRTVMADADEYWLLSVDIESDAPIGAQVQVRLETSNFITLVTNPSFPVQDYVEATNFTDEPLPETLVKSQPATVIEPNAPPNAPTDGFSPADTPYPPAAATVFAVISDRTPIFRWDAATDNLTDPADPNSGDDPADLYYEIELATDAAMTNIIFSSNTQATPGVTEFTLPNANELPDPAGVAVDYHWRLRTVDTDGARSPASVTLHFQLIGNQAPTEPTGYFWPSGGIQITFTAPTYLWSHGTDPDTNDTFDTLLYHIQVDDNNDFSSPIVNESDIPVPALTPDGSPMTDADPMWFTHPVDIPNGKLPLSVGVTYHWRVMTFDAQGTPSPNWSVVQVFEVVDNQAPYPPIAPFTPSADDEVNSAQPTLIWHSEVRSGHPGDPNGVHYLTVVPFPLRYHVQMIGDAGDFADGPFVLNRDNLNDTTVPSVSVDTANNELTLALTTSDLTDNTHYRYRIRVKDSGVPELYSDWGPVQSFWVNTKNDAPEPPISGFDPTGGATIGTATPTCTWDHATDPDPTDDDTNLHYIVEFSKQQAFGTVVYQYTTAEGVNSVTLTELLDDLMTWYWRVRTVDDSGAVSGWSVVQSFVVDTTNELPTAPLDGFIPPDGSNVSDTTPRFEWNPGTDDTTPENELWYELDLATDAVIDTTSTIYSGNTLANLGTTQLTLPAGNALPQPAAGETVDYYWRVRTVDGAGARSAWSGVLHFILGDNNPPNAPTDGFWPAGGAQVADDTPTYRWNHATDPDANDTFDTLRYNIQIDDNNDFSSPLVDVVDIPVPAGTALTDPVTFDHPAGTPLTVGVMYFWRVMTKDVQDATSDQWSATQNFEVVQNRAPYAPIAPFSPVDGEEVTTERPTISWETADPPDPDVRDVLDTLDFYVQLKADANLDEGPYAAELHVQLSEADVTPGDFTVSVALTQDLDDNTQYWYRVRARDLDGAGRYSDWSAIQNFWVNTANDNPDKPCTGFRPNNGTTISDAMPTFYWTHSEDPDPYDDETNMEYIVQISRVGTSPQDFADAMAYQYTTDTNSVTATEALEDLTTWYWRVRARDNSGALSQWSDIQDFYLDTNNSDPLLLAGSVIEPYGYLSNYYEYYVTYQDAENDPPGWVRVTIDLGESREQTLPMVKVTAGDNDYVGGVAYSVGIAGVDLGYGAHTWVFISENGARLPDALPDTGAGPVVGSDAILRFVDAVWADADEYEETATVYVQINDQDENLNPAFRETIHVYLYDVSQTDVEVLALRERGINDGIFRGSIPLRGAPGANNDGSLNVIAGANGVQIVAHYFDKDDANNPTPDERQDTAMVVDTAAPSPVNAPVNRLIVTSGTSGRSAQLDWTAYDEDAEIDVAGYRIYYGENDFANTGSPDAQLYADVGAGGSQTVTVTGLTPDVRYYFAVVAYDEVPNPGAGAAVAVTTTDVITRDTSAPLITNLFPADGALDVPLDTQISFRIADDGTGVDLTTLDVEVTVDGNPAPIDVDTDDQGTYVAVTVQPTDPFNWNDQVTVNVDISDNVPAPDTNSATAQWSFTMVTDTVDPVVERQDPEDGATGVPVNLPITFHLTDDIYGVDVSTLIVTLNGADITADVTTNEVNGTRDIGCSYTAANGLQYNTTYTVVVSVSDFAGNSSGDSTWSFDTVEDGTSVLIDQFDPAKDATDVPIDTNISMRMTDTEAGVNSASIRMWVNGVEVTSQLTKTSGGVSVMVEYNPADDFAYSTDVLVRVYVEDNTGNITDMTYKFTIAAPETYVITGRVLTAQDAPVPGVTITCNGNEASTDGNGSFVLSDVLEGTYTVTPTKDEWLFAPVSQEVSVGPDDASGINFIGTLITYEIAGRAADRDGNGVAGVAIAFSSTGSVQTDANGDYVIEGLRRGQYTLTPSLQYYHFNPVNRVVEVVDADVAGTDFIVIPDTFSISGTVYNSVGQRVQGVQVTNGDSVAVTDIAGRYTLSNLAMGTHTLTASKVGFKVLPAQLEVTLPPDYDGADFTAYYELSNSFPAGYNLIGVPGTPIDPNPTRVFSTNSVARWNPSSTPPAYVLGATHGDTDFMRVRPAHGYFVRFDAPADLSIAAEPTNTARSVSIGVGVDWNMIANPFANPTPFVNFQPTIAGGIRPYAYIYNNATGSYELVSSRASINAIRDNLQPWEAAWVLCVAGGTSLTITPPVEGAAVGEVEPADIGSGYVIPVVASANGRSDTCSVAGVIPNAGAEHTLLNPPTAPATVDLYFVNDSGQRLSRDIRSHNKLADTFDFVVSSAVGPASVTVALPDLSTVPHNYEVMLTDLDADKTVYARTMQSYTYRCVGETGLRHFRIAVQSRTVGSLNIATAAAAQQGGAAVISYSVSQACRVTVTIRNIAGRSVKVLAADKVTAAGLQTETWNLSSEAGTKVPAGPYLIEIQARADSGQQARAMARINLTR